MVFIFLLNNNEMGKGAPERHLAPSSYETSARHCETIDRNLKQANALREHRQLT